MTSRFFKNAAIMAMAEFLGKAKALIVMPLLLRHVGAEGFGAWSQVTMMTMLVLPLIMLSSDGGLIRLFPGLDDAARGRAFTAWVLWLAGASVVWAVIAIAARSTLTDAFFSNDPAYGQFVALAAINIIVSSLLSAGRTWFRYRNDAATVASISMGQAVMNVAAVAFGILYGFSTRDIVILTIAGDAVVSVGALARYTVQQGWSWPDFGVVRRMILFGLPLVPAGYAMWGLNWADRLFLVHYRGLSDVGLYAATSSLGYVVIQLFVNPIWMMYPSVATDLYQRKAVPELNNVVRSTSTAMVALAIPAALGLWALGGRVTHLFAIPDFTGVSEVMAVIALGYLLSMISSYYEVTLGLVYRQHLSTAAILLAVAVNLVLNFILIPPYGVLGAAIATMAAFAAQLTFSLLAARRHAAEWRGPRFPWRVITAAAIMALVVRGLSQWWDDASIAPLCALILCGALVYGVLAVAGGVVPLHNLTLVMRDFGNWRRHVLR